MYVSEQEVGNAKASGSEENGVNCFPVEWKELEFPPKKYDPYQVIDAHRDKTC